MTDKEKEMADSIIKDHQKRIIDLEKENAELKKKNELLLSEPFVKACYDELSKKADTNHQLVEQMAKLAEENAELSKALEESEKREKELCIMAENLKAELKKIRCAYITEKVGNLCNGVDTDNLFQSAK